MQIGVWGLAHSNLQDYGVRHESGLARDRTTPGLADFDFSLTNVSPSHIMAQLQHSCPEVPNGPSL